MKIMINPIVYIPKPEQIIKLTKQACFTVFNNERVDQAIIILIPFWRVFHTILKMTVQKCKASLLYLEINDHSTFVSDDLSKPCGFNIFFDIGNLLYEGFFHKNT